MMRVLKISVLIMIIATQTTIAKQAFDYFKEYAKKHSYNLASTQEAEDYVEFARHILLNTLKNDLALKNTLQNFIPTESELTEIIKLAGESYWSTIKQKSWNTVKIIPYFDSVKEAQVNKAYGYPESFNKLRHDFYVEYIQQNPPPEKWHDAKEKANYLKSAMNAFAAKHDYVTAVLAAFKKLALTDSEIKTLKNEIVTSTKTTKPESLNIKDAILGMLKNYAQQNKFNFSNFDDKKYYLARFKQVIVTLDDWKSAYENNSAALTILNNLNPTDSRVNKILSDDAKLQPGYKVLFGYLGESPSPLSNTDIMPPEEFYLAKYTFYKDYFAKLTVKQKADYKKAIEFSADSEKYIKEMNDAFAKKQPYLHYVLQTFSQSALTPQDFEQLVTQTSTPMQLKQKNIEQIKKQEEEELKKTIEEEKEKVTLKKQQQEEEITEYQEKEKLEEKEKQEIVDKEVTTVSKNELRKKLVPKLQAISTKITTLDEYRNTEIYNFVVDTIDETGSDISDIDLEEIDWQEYTKDASDYVEEQLNLKRVITSYLKYINFLAKNGIKTGKLTSKLETMQKGVTEQELIAAAQRLTEEAEIEEEDTDDDGEEE